MVANMQSKLPATTAVLEDNLSVFDNRQNLPLPPFDSQQIGQLNPPVLNAVGFAMPSLEKDPASSLETQAQEQAQPHNSIPNFYDNANAVGGINRTVHDLFGNFQGLYDDPAWELHHGVSFMPRDAYQGQEYDFDLWDLDLEGIELAYQGLEDNQIPQGPAHAPSVAQTDTSKAISRRSAAFRRSTWIWNPTQNDQTMRGQDDHHLDERSISSLLTPTPNSPMVNGNDFASCCMTTHRRDQILGILHTLRRDSTQFPSLPTLPLLNEIIQVYFLYSNNWIDHMVHAASFDGANALPQLLLSIIAAGSALISIPAIWKMGLALQEVVRVAVGEFVSCIASLFVTCQILISVVGAK